MFEIVDRRMEYVAVWSKQVATRTVKIFSKQMKLPEFVGSQYVDSSSIAFAKWQRQQAIRQRAKLLQLHCDLEDDDKDGGGPSAEANRDDERARVDIDTEGHDEVEGEVDAEEDFKEI